MKNKQDILAKKYVPLKQYKKVFTCLTLLMNFHVVTYKQMNHSCLVEKYKTRAHQ